MTKIFANLGIKSDSELKTGTPSPGTGSGSTGTGTTTPPPPTTGTGTAGTGSTLPPKDTIPPITTILPTVSGITQTGVTLSVGLNEDGTGYYLVQPQNSPTPAQSTIIANNKTISLKANISGSIKIDGLNANTAYKIWFVAKDLSGNLQTTVSFTAFTTLALKGNIPPTLTYSAKLITKNTYELAIVAKDSDGTIAGYGMYMNGGILFTNLSKVTVRIA